MSLFNQKWNMKKSPFSISQSFSDKKQSLVEQMKNTIEKNKGAALDASVEKAAKQRPKLSKCIIGKRKKISKIVIPEIIVDEIKNNEQNKVLSEVLSSDTSVEETINETEVTEETSETQDKPLPTFNPPNYAVIDVNDLINALSVVAKYCLNSKKEIDYLEENIHNTDYETSDFLHSIELSSFVDSEKEDIFDKLMEIRRRRRTYKKRLELLREVQNFVSKTSDIATKLGTLKNTLVKIQEKQNNAVFHTKIRNDIKEDEYVRIGIKK